jgi:hypothetical protein
MLFRANEGVSRPNGQENDPQFAGLPGGAFAFAPSLQRKLRSGLLFGTARVFCRLISDRATLQLRTK